MTILKPGRRRTSKNRLRWLKFRAACHAERKARFPMLVLRPVVPVEQKRIGLGCDVPWRISGLGRMRGGRLCERFRQVRRTLEGLVGA